jgi:hypothetical protein
MSVLYAHGCCSSGTPELQTDRQAASLLTLVGERQDCIVSADQQDLHTHHIRSHHITSQHGTARHSTAGNKLMGDRVIGETM